MSLRKASPHNAILGRRVRALRHSRGLSRKELADGLGITFQQLQKYEDGTHRITAARLHEISKLLQVPISSWFGDDTQATRSEPGRRDERELVTSARAIRLLKSFSQIEDANIQNLIVSLCEGLAAKQ